MKRFFVFGSLALMLSFVACNKNDQGQGKTGTNSGVQQEQESGASGPNSNVGGGQSDSATGTTSP